MEAGQKVEVRQPSFWSRTREVYDENDAQLGLFEVTSRWSYRRAVGTAFGKKLIFTNNGWNTWKSEVRESDDRVVGSIERKGWCGNRSRIILYEKEYTWRLSTWGTHFWIESGGEELVRVSGCGGFGRIGYATFNQPMDSKEAIMLVMLGLYQMRLYETEIAVTTAIMASAVAIAA